MLLAVRSDDRRGETHVKEGRDEVDTERRRRCCDKRTNGCVDECQCERRARLSLQHRRDTLIDGSASQF